ncbi:hypothetical protein XM38_017000 [Halomicronema hongdechloris C2206]|uniref:Uncharacterized protein n=1 Tax=Halomicronema hongdechloris C2206 TaxID=1641165 RepID=A0A1Z3HKB1_9CYAN|nr:hypothetical protein [Halomicronema hongdechloris]ASC70754.1 hypothetical protein XM38_017000 [Halomicronema hongdechloris C2206]
MAYLRTLPPTVPNHPRQTLAKLAAILGLCGIGAALPLLTSEGQVSSMRPVAPSLAQLATPPELRLPVSLANGTDIEPPRGQSGYSQLTIANGNDVDAVAKLVDAASGQTLRVVYVQAHKTVVLENLGAGTRLLKFALGTDWDAQQQQFRRLRTVLAFSEPLEFVVQRDDTSEYWKTYEVTLHPVLHGQAQTEPIPEDEF